MAYVLVYVMGDLKYYVQKNSRGEVLLNGLIDNAIKYAWENKAKEDKSKYEMQFYPLHIEEVLP